MLREDAPNSPERPAELATEGFDLRWLLGHVWGLRRQCVAALAVFTLLFWIVAGVKVLLQDDFVRYTKDIKLVFESVDSGQYPDGTVYSPSNIIAPVVLNEVYEANGLAAQEVPVPIFVNAFAVQAYAPESEFIVQRYRRLLETRNLGVAEIRGLEEQFLQEIQQAARSGARITLTLRGGTLSDELASKVLDDVPLFWKRYMIDRRGVFKLDAPFISAQALDLAVLEGVDHLVMYDILRGRLQNVLEGITALREMPNSDNIVDAESGLGLADLESVLEDLRDLTLEQVATVATGFGLSRDADRTARYFEKRIEDMQRERELLSDKSRLVADALDKYTDPDRRRSASPPGVTETIGGATIPQFGSDFLDRLVELGSSSGDLEFRQALSRERLDFGLQAADIESEVRRLSELVTRLRATRKPHTALVYKEMSKEVEQELDDARMKLVRLIGVLSRLREELERFNYGTDRAMYRDLGTDPRKSTSAMVLTAGNLQWYAVLTLLLLMALPIFVFAQAMMRNRPNES